MGMSIAPHLSQRGKGTVSLLRLNLILLACDSVDQSMWNGFLRKDRRAGRSCLGIWIFEVMGAADVVAVVAVVVVVFISIQLQLCKNAQQNK
jgi:hypothetical protein